MDGSLPTSLKHIISNAEYYGPSLFLLGEFKVVLKYSFKLFSLLKNILFPWLDCYQSSLFFFSPALIFLPATEVVTVFVFQEPSLLSSLQDNGLTDVMLHALLIKDVSFQHSHRAQSRSFLPFPLTLFKLMDSSNKDRLHSINTPKWDHTVAPAGCMNLMA